MDLYERLNQKAASEAALRQPYVFWAANTVAKEFTHVPLLSFTPELSRQFDAWGDRLGYWTLSDCSASEAIDYIRKLLSYTQQPSARSTFGFAIECNDPDSFNIRVWSKHVSR